VIQVDVHRTREWV